MEAETDSNAPTIIEGDTFDPPVFITAALEQRPAKKTDYLREKTALQELAGRMIDQPAEVLPRFVDLAMEMTEGISAGISLYEEHAPSPGVFRWRYLRGLLARFEGATTPRNYSPCGVTLDQKRPVLTLHSERMYDWIARENLILPEVLLVPLYLGGTQPLGTLWIVSDETEHFDSGHARIVRELATFVGIALHMLHTEQQLKEALEEQEMLAHELDHRIKNAFSLIEAMIRISMRDASTPERMSEVLSGRLHALANAHSLVGRNLRNAVTAGAVSDLAILLGTIIRPFDGPGAIPRFSLNGPSVRLSESATNGIALIFHELATNCAKYGALSADSGQVHITWKTENANLIVHWSEQGGPPIMMPPGAKGFGSALVENTIKHQFEGMLQPNWSREGLNMTLILPLNRLSF